MMRIFEVDKNQVEQIEGMTEAYPYCMHLRDLTNFLVPWHWHEEVELGYIDCGASQIITTGGTYDVHAGEAFFINTNVVDMKRNGLPGERTLEVNHIFHPVFLAGHFKSRFETKYLKPVLNNRQIDVHVIRPASDTGKAILRNLKELRALQEEPNVEFQTRNLLSATWLFLMEDVEKNGAVRRSSERQDRIRTMLAFIRSHYAEKLTAGDIAASCGVSEREALRCFQRGLSRTPMDYLTEVRLEAAGKLLVETEEPVTEIAFRVGFSSSAYFGKVFKNAYYMSPTQFRRTSASNG